jgi:hypothetical protein
MLDLERSADSMADQVRDLMDPVWYRLSQEEIALLDSRGEIDPAELFPVRLPLPPPTGTTDSHHSRPTVRGRRYWLAGTR